MLRNMLAAGALLAAFSVFAPAQQPRGTASQQAPSADTGDFVQDGLKFHRMTPPGFTPSTYMVTDTSTSNPAGEIIDRGGDRTFLAFAGYDKSKLQTAWEKHMNAGGASAAVQSASTGKEDALSAVQSPAAAAAGTGFDAASKTVTLADGRAVTFVDGDNLRVQLPGPAGVKTYALRFHKAGAGGFMKGWAGREQGRVGGSLGGGGVTITLQSRNGMPGGEVYDTAKGAVYGNSGLAQAKAVTAAVREAADVVNSAQPDLAKLNVVKSLLSNNLGL
jgi:hypothetical protein